MDFLNPKKKRAHRIRLFIGYGLMAIALGIATFILLFAAYGYDIDRKTGNIIQNGLIIADAHPEAAQVIINGDSKGQTNRRLILPAGDYHMELRREGYRSWSHDIHLEGSSIEQLVYPFLFPNRLITNNILSMPESPDLASQSPDRRWLVIHDTKQAGRFVVVDLNDKDNPSSAFNLPADAFTAAEGRHIYQEIEWSTDNSNLLVRHSWNGGNEYVMINRDRPDTSYNLTKRFSTVAIASIALRDKKADQFLLLTDKSSLYAANASSQDLDLLSNNVLTFKGYQASTVLFVTRPADTKVEAQVKVWHQGNVYSLRTLPQGKSYLLEMASFSNRFYLAIGSSSDGRVYLYRDPIRDLENPSRSPQPFRVLVTKGAQHVSFSGNARFIAVQGGSEFAIYDAETNRQHKYDVQLKLAPGQKAVWMDGHRLLLNSENKVFCFDFDGTNKNELSAASPNFRPWFDRDYTALFTIVPGQNNVHNLTRTELIVPPPGTEDLQ